jgi:copper chaperone
MLPRWPPSTWPSSSSSAAAVVETLTLEVHGMSCGGCERRVRDALSALDGVATVTPEHIGDEVEVIYDPLRVAADEIAAAISALGFDVVG